MGAFLSVHAVRQMQRRGIERHEVEHVLALPEVTMPSEERSDRTVVLGTTAAGRRLKVVVSATDNNYVITVAGRDEEA